MKNNRNRYTANLRMESLQAACIVIVELEYSIIPRHVFILVQNAQFAKVKSNNGFCFRFASLIAISFFSL